MQTLKEVVDSLGLPNVKNRIELKKLKGFDVKKKHAEILATLFDFYIKEEGMFVSYEEMVKSIFNIKMLFYKTFIKEIPVCKFFDEQERKMLFAMSDYLNNVTLACLLVISGSGVDCKNPKKSAAGK